jgi:amino acid adenylation domain-containing protein
VTDHEMSDAEKRALLLELLDKGPAAPAEMPAVGPRDSRAAAPLSAAQERLWFLAELEPTSTAYHLGWRLRLRGALDVAALGHSLDELVRRHESLRTTFRGGEAPAQIVSPPQPLGLVLEDVTGLDPAARARAIARRAEETVLAPFDLLRGPLLRVALLRADEDEHVLVFGLHHILFDGWSFGLFTRELAALYEAFAAGRTSPLPAPALQYADFAAWQASTLTPSRMEPLLTYWTRQLRGLPPRVALPFDRPVACVAGVAGRCVRALPPALLAEAEALARAEGVTTFVILLAAFYALLHRVSGQEDLVVGTPATARDRVELEAIVGCFVNLLVLRVAGAAGDTFHTLLARVRDTARQAQAHGALPYQRIVEALDPGRDLSDTRLFQVTFQAQEFDSSQWRLPGLAVQLEEAPIGAAKFDLCVSIDLGTAGGLISAEYAGERFEAATIDALLGQYEALLATALAQPEERVGALPLGPPAPAPPVEAPPAGDRCLHELFAAQARRTPEAIALTYETTHWSYDTLDRRANRLARLLAARGAGAETRVALWAEPSLEMLVGMIAVLKSGAAYVPIDPTFPAARIEHLVRDSGARFFLTWGGQGDLSACDVALVDVDLALAEGSDAALATPVQPANLAYVLYTSGSAGAPKGVLIEHRQVPDLFAHLPPAPSPSQEVWALAHAPSFDVSVLEIWGALIRGARLVVVPSEVRRSPPALRALLVREQVTVLFQTPTAFRELGPLGTELPLRLLVLGGEALDFARLRGAVSPATALRNGYGPTETTIFTTLRPIAPEEVERVPGSMIGPGLPGRTLHVLDDVLRPVPVGVCGEIYIGGAGVARGYAGNPALTAERFVPDPLGSPGARLYRTGDLGRLTRDGDVQFLGRADQQVKIRGFRIEPGEIEHALEQHPQVRAAVVVVREREPGDPRLVAYVVLRGEGASLDELRLHARCLLPEYMIPSLIVPLTELPRSTSDKLDRDALPAPDWTREARVAYVAPRTPVEEALAAIWCEVLGLDRIGTQDHFFDLGGHSLLATRLMARVRARFAIELSLRRLFEQPTLGGLAQVIEGLIAR